MTYCINFICLQFNGGEGSRNREDGEGEDSCKTQTGCDSGKEEEGNTKKEASDCGKCKPSYFIYLNIIAT